MFPEVGGPVSDLQFDRAEMETGTLQTCVICKQSVGGEYYAVNNHIVCSGCRARLGDGISPVTSHRVVMAMLHGAVAAIIGGTAWGLVTYYTHWQLGIVAVFVGLGIGRFVRTGSGGLGGPVFQAIAVGWTYLAIAGSWIPVMLKGQDDVDWFAIVSTALAEPVRIAAKGDILGLLINGFAIYEAWKVTRRPAIQITGPFRVRTAPPAEGTAGG